MFEVIVGLLIAVPISFGLRKICALQHSIALIREKHRNEFYRLADEVVIWENVTDKRLKYLSDLSAVMSLRHTQFAAIGVIREASKEWPETSSRDPAAHADMSSGQAATWRALFFHWLTAVCA